MMSGNRCHHEIEVQHHLLDFYLEPPAHEDVKTDYFNLEYSDFSLHSW
jgi:hypothetical protein